MAVFGLYSKAGCQRGGVHDGSITGSSIHNRSVQRDVHSDAAHP